MGAAAVVGQPPGLEGGGGGDDPLVPLGFAEVVARAEPLELSIGLAWAPAYAGDPLDVFVRMDAALYQQTQVLQLGGGAGGLGGMTNLPSLAATWADGVTLELARLRTGGLREVVLASNAWTAFRRTASNDVWGGLSLPVVTAEWFVTATNVSLTALAQGSTSRDVAYNTLRDQSALRPALNLVPPQSGQPWKLLITAWPDQFVEAQQSADLTTWQTVQSARIGADGFLEITAISANDPGRHFYRVVWQP